jgi:hypothetical protein
VASEPTIEDLARVAWGEPNREQSTRTELRFGSHGSKSVKIKERVWHDHETGEGGGYIDLYKIVHGEMPPRADDGIQVAYDYRDESGHLLFQVVRKLPKKFVQRQPDGDGGWTWSAKGIRKVPYRLPELLAAGADQIVFVAEGEKDCDRLASLGLVATTNPGGAGKWRADMGAALKGRHVVVLPDNDEPGEEHAVDVARKLRGTAASVRVLRLPHLPEKGDVSDWLANGGSREALLELARREQDRPEAVVADEDSSLVVDLSEWEESDLQERRWLVPGHFMRGVVTILAGPPGSGKSIVAIGFAVACALGRPYGRFHPVGPLKVAIYNPEDDLMEQKRRISATLRQFAASPRDLEARLLRIFPSGRPELFLWGMNQQGAYDAIATSQWTELCNLCERHQPDILMLDPSAELATVPVNDTEGQRLTMSHYRALANRFSMSVVLIDHTAKERAGNAGDQNMVKGAGSKVGSSRIVLTCTNMSEEEAAAYGVVSEARHAYLRITDAKHNYSAFSRPQWYEKTTYVLDHGEEVGAAEPWTPRDAAALDEGQIASMVTEIGKGIGGEPYSPHKGRSFDRSITHLMDKFEIRGAAAVSKVIQRLYAHGVVVVKFRAGQRNKPMGLRTAAGLPAVDWVDEPEAQPPAEVGSASVSDENASVYGDDSVTPADDMASLSDDVVDQLVWPTE